MEQLSRGRTAVVATALFATLIFVACPALGSVTILRCEGKDIGGGDPRELHNYSVVFDADKKILKLNGSTFDKDLVFERDNIGGARISGGLSGNNSLPGTRSMLTVNRVTGDFIFSTIPEALDGSKLSSEQLMRYPGPFAITGTCTKAQS